MYLRLLNAIATTAALLIILATFPRTIGSTRSEAKDVELPELPTTLPQAMGGAISLPDHQGMMRPTTLLPELQEHLDSFIAQSKSPIAAVVVADAKTGQILAMSQGRHPNKWDGKVHSALHPSFPAASLFKTVVTAAAFELADMDPKETRPLYGGCQHVGPAGHWLKDEVGGRKNGMTLHRAYGASCNSFYAKIAVNDLGLGIVTNFARRFGWGTGIPTDFKLATSPFRPPVPQYASAHTVGQYAAGFGYVGTSAVHAAWTMLTIANDGVVKPITLFADTPTATDQTFSERLFRPETAQRLRGVMDATVQGGTASFAFRRGKTRKLRELVGGKTGTLTGHSPFGVTTWFAGMMPTEDPEVVVAAVVVLEDLWFIKGPSLAAEALWKYREIQKQRHLAKTE